MPPRRDVRSPPRVQPQHGEAEEIRQQAREIREIKERLATAEQKYARLEKCVAVLFFLVLLLVASSTSVGRACLAFLTLVLAQLVTFLAPLLAVWFVGWGIS